MVYVASWGSNEEVRRQSDRSYARRLAAAGGPSVPHEDAREIVENVSGFFTVLLDWETNEQRRRALTGKACFFKLQSPSESESCSIRFFELDVEGSNYHRDVLQPCDNVLAVTNMAKRKDRWSC
jgi:hypothetical protein